jgi:hypothetical protein
MEKKMSEPEPPNTKQPEPGNQGRFEVKYPSPIFPDFDQAGMPCPTCGTRAPLPTVRVPVPHARPVDGQTPCMQFHVACWQVVTLMQHHASVMLKKNGHGLALPPAKRLILPPRV